MSGGTWADFGTKAIEVTVRFVLERLWAAAAVAALPVLALATRIWTRLRNKDARIGRALRRTAQRERVHRDIVDLEKLRQDGVSLRGRYRQRTITKASSVEPAWPAEDIRYDGFEFDEWSGQVILKLKAICPSDLETYFQDCVDVRVPIDRMRCYLERLDKIIAELKKKTR